MTMREKTRGIWRRALAHQHSPGLRVSLDLLEGFYQMLRRARRDSQRPACAGSWPARLVPLPTPKPYGRGERAALRRLLRRQGTSSSDSDEVLKFEAELSGKFAAPFATAVSSGAAAIHTALIAAQIGPGDEVVVPVLTHPLTALPVLQQGARVRFVDAHPGTWNIDVTGIEAALGERTKAVIVVHLCGVPCDMDGIRELTRRRGLVLIEDAAQAHGSRHGGEAIGTLGNLGCFSFQSAKSLTTGEGGAVLSSDPELARRVRLAMNVGEAGARGRHSPSVEVFHEREGVEQALLGWNYRMSALQAALGRGQLGRMHEICAARRNNARELSGRLAEIDGLELQGVLPESEPCHSSLFFLLPEHVSRDALTEGLARERIDFRLPYQKPLAAHELFDVQGAFPVAEDICRRALGFKVDPAYGPSELRAIAFALKRNLAWLG